MQSAKSGSKASRRNLARWPAATARALHSGHKGCRLAVYFRTIGQRLQGRPRAGSRFAKSNLGQCA